jgi:hypothetical protein
MGERQPDAVTVLVRYLAVAALVLGLVFVVQAYRAFSGFGNVGDDGRVDTEAIVETVLADAPPIQRFGVTVDEPPTGCRGSPALLSSASDVWTVLSDDEAEALESIEERAVAHGYARRAVEDRVVEEGPAPLRVYVRVREPTTIEVHAREVAVGTELTVTVYETCTE